jgi:succinate dehydrogenase/fumarate reductase-like Fe-S protein
MLENVENVTHKKLSTKIRGELRCSGKMSSFCFTCDTFVVMTSTTRIPPKKTLEVNKDATVDRNSTYEHSHVIKETLSW